jgi:hypothetical protein
MSSAAPELQTKSPRLFTPRVVVVLCLWGLLLMAPVLASMALVSVLRLGPLTFLIPLATITVATFFLPLGFGNTYLAKRFGPVYPAGAQPGDVFLVQLTREPRSRSDFLALLEDADDIGFLNLTDGALVFEGDSLRLNVPYGQIRDLALRNSGWRALFAYGPRTAFSVEGLPEAGRFEFAERSSWHLPGSRKNALRIYQRLKEQASRAT